MLPLGTDNIHALVLSLGLRLRDSKCYSRHLAGRMSLKQPGMRTSLWLLVRRSCGASRLGVSPRKPSKGLKRRSERYESSPSLHACAETLLGGPLDLLM